MFPEIELCAIEESVKNYLVLLASNEPKAVSVLAGSMDVVDGNLSLELDGKKVAYFTQGTWLYAFPQFEIQTNLV